MRSRISSIIALTLALSVASAAVPALSVASTTTTQPGQFTMPRPVARPLSLDQLNAFSKPQGKLEAVPQVFFDVENYVSAATVSLTFFNSAQNSQFRSNLNGSGQLPANNWFVLHKLHITPIIPPSFNATAGNNGGALLDMFKLVQGGLPTLTMSLNAKPVIPSIPAAMCQSGFGVTGGIAASLTAPAAKEFANNGIPGGGYDVNGWIIIPPGVNFSIVIAWNAAQTLTNGNTDIMLAMEGDLYRPTA